MSKGQRVVLATRYALQGGRSRVRIGSPSQDCDVVANRFFLKRRQ